MMKRTYAPATAAAVSLALAVSGAPAQAQSWPQFNAAASSAFMSLAPDVCIPYATSEYCITFTNATYSAALAGIENQESLGQIAQQAAQGITFSQTSSATGESDPSGAQDANAQCTASSGDPNTPADDQANYINSSEGTNMSGLDSIASAVFNEGYNPGTMSGSQWTSLATLELQAQIQKQQCFAAAQHQQQQQQTVNAVTPFTDIFDLNNADPEAGWNT